jgi:LacI family transcriptional regulator
MPKHVTIRDVAKVARVSTATVSYVLNQTNRVSPTTKRTVLAAVRRLGYLPNANARNLARKISQTLGMIVSDIENPFFPDVIKGFEKRARERGYNVILSDTGYDSAELAMAAKRMLREGVRGIALITSEAAPQVVRPITSRRTALTFLDVGPVQTYASNIKIDYFAGIKAIIDHLVALGHTHIAFVGARDDLYSNAARRHGYVQCMRALGLTVGPVLEGDSHFDGGLAAGTTIVQLKPMPTAVVAMNDLTAIGIMKAVCARGLDVPGDISVTGHDFIQMTQYTSPSLTTLDLKRDLLGRIAADSLHDLFASPTHMGQEYVVVPELRLGQSTGPPRRARKA